MCTYLDKESDGFTAIQKTVIVGESKVHHLKSRDQYGKRKCHSYEVESYWADFNLAVDGHRLILDGVESQNGYKELEESM